MKEIWKQCLKYENYEISNFGNIRNIKKQKLLKPGLNSFGYKRVNLRYKNKQKTCSIHRLLMLTFKPDEYFEEATVNHIDGNKLNNSLDNLEWCTVKENLQHAHKNGLMFKTNLGGSKGEANKSSKLKEFQIEEIKSLYKSGIYHKDIAKLYNVSRVNITHIINNKRWKHI